MHGLSPSIQANHRMLICNFFCYNFVENYLVFLVLKLAQSCCLCTDRNRVFFLLQEIVGRMIGSKAGRLIFGWRFWDFPGFFLVIDTEKGFAFFTTFLVLIDKFVQSIEIWRSGAVHIVPPITNKILLIENCAIGAQKWIVIAVGLTHVKDLKIKLLLEKRPLYNFCEK